MAIIFILRLQSHRLSLQNSDRLRDPVALLKISLLFRFFDCFSVLSDLETTNIPTWEIF
jgi:hypothetical protein